MRSLKWVFQGRASKPYLFFIFLGLNLLNVFDLFVTRLFFELEVNVILIGYVNSFGWWFVSVVKLFSVFVGSFILYRFSVAEGWDVRLGFRVSAGLVLVMLFFVYVVVLFQNFLVLLRVFF